MKTNEQKALDACREYVRVRGEIERLGQDIGAALSKCPGNGEIETDSEGFGFRLTHLRDWYRNGDLAKEWAFMGYGGPDYKAAFEACPHCVEADRLIQARKKLRLTLGAAKRQITRLGKT